MEPLNNNTISVFYNEKCSKCRGSKSLLEEILEKQSESTKSTINFINYLEPNTLTKDSIQNILSTLNIQNVREIMRSGEKIFKELELQNEELTQEQLIEKIVENPVLLERPIVLYQGKGVVARPPEKLVPLFEN